MPHNFCDSDINPACSEPSLQAAVVSDVTPLVNRPWLVRCVRLPRVKTLLLILASLTLCGAIGAAGMVYERHRFLVNLADQGGSVSFHDSGWEWLRERVDYEFMEWVDPIQSLRLNNSDAIEFLSRRVYLRGLESLELEADLEHNLDFDRGLVLAAQLPQLSTVSLLDGRVTRRGLEALRQLPQLHELSFYNVRSAPEDFASVRELSRITSLNLGGEGISDAHLAPLEGLPQLQELWMSDTSVTDAGLSALRRLTHLKILNVGGVRVTGAGVSALNALPLLESLSLASSSVTDAELDRLSGCGRVKRLNLENNPITDAGITRFVKSHPQLKSLALEGTNVTQDCSAKLLRDHGIAGFSTRVNNSFCGFGMQ